MWGIAILPEELSASEEELCFVGFGQSVGSACKRTVIDSQFLMVNELHGPESLRS
jgi:hypothetical protein